jgi:hypothetical protein
MSRSSPTVKERPRRRRGGRGGGGRGEGGRGEGRGGGRGGGKVSPHLPARPRHASYGMMNGEEGKRSTERGSEHGAL